jgi:phage shock protein C
MSTKKELYRDPKNGKIAGVCAGVAEYFGWELWLVRIITITGFLLSGSFFVVAYIAGWFILDKKPEGSIVSAASNKFKDVKDEILEKSIEVKEKVWQAGEPPRQALHDILSKFDGVEEKLQKMEKHVTSPQFTVSREINKL